MAAEDDLPAVVLSFDDFETSTAPTTRTPWRLRFALRRVNDANGRLEALARSWLIEEDEDLDGVWDLVDDDVPGVAQPPGTTEGTHGVHAPAWVGLRPLVPAPAPPCAGVAPYERS